MMYSTPSGSSRRSGFTLIELMIVISIIAVLVALSVGAFFRVRVSQQEKATENTLVKIQSEFNNQLRAVYDQCKDDLNNGAIPASVVALAGESGAPGRRSLVVWFKMKMVWEFPQSFFEAQNWPTQVAQNAFFAQYPNPQPMPGIAAQAYMKPAYYQALGSSGASQNPGTVQQFQESAALFYMALTQGRRGNKAFSPVDQVGPQSIATVVLYGTSFNVFVDAFGNPISFIRWPSGGNWSDLNVVGGAPSPLAPVNGAGLPIDPQDPERSLVDQDWNSSSLASTFANLLHPVATNNYPLNLTPVIFSWGRDGNPGVDAFFNYGGAAENDNIYAYRLIGAGRGAN